MYTKAYSTTAKGEVGAFPTEKVKAWAIQPSERSRVHGGVDDRTCNVRLDRSHFLRLLLL